MDFSSDCYDSPMGDNALEMFVLGRLAELEAAEKPLLEKLASINAEKEKLRKAVEAVGLVD